MSTHLPHLRIPIVGALSHCDEVISTVRQQLPVVDPFTVDTIDACLAQLDHDNAPGNYVPACVVTSEVGNVDDAISALAAHPSMSECRYILVTTRRDHDDVARSLNDGQLLSVMTDPVTSRVLVRQLARRVVRWVTYRHPDEEWSQTILEPAETLITHGAAEFSRQLETSSTELSAHLLSVIEEELGPRPRLHIPAGVDLTRQGWPVHGVYLVLEGAVALHQSFDDGADVLLHHASSGPLIGLTSFTRRSLAAFTSKTTTPIVAVRITLEQLERVMEAQPALASLLAMVSLRALSDRLVRAEQLHIEKERLADALEVEHEKTAQATREQLAQARHELEEAAQFAMLGHLAAGIAHELNNPIAAIVRAADHAGEATGRLLDTLNLGEGARQVLDAAGGNTWRSAKETRQLTRELAAQLGGDRRAASALVDMGITEPAQARRLAGETSNFEALRSVHGIGASLHDIGLASRRITGLVRSLRSYSRSGDYLVDDVDVHEGLENTLRLSAPQLSGVTLTRHYDPNLPAIRCFPSRLEQVWTNILVNAAEAMGEDTERPEITITTTRHGDDAVRVRFEDNGPGIPPELLDRIFLPRFTTKQGTVHYGLGMGLGICRQIVDAHTGTIKATNGERGAVMTVTLPIDGPGDTQDETKQKEQEK